MGFVDLGHKFGRQEVDRMEDGMMEEVHFSWKKKGFPSSYPAGVRAVDL